MAETRVLRITECVPGFSGNGYTLYNIKAQTEDGQAVAHKLNSFSDLPMGVGTYTVTPYKRDGVLVAFTLARVKDERDLEADVDALAEMVQDLSRKFDEILSTMTSARAAAATPEDDIPF